MAGDKRLQTNPWQGRIAVLLLILAFIAVPAVALGGTDLLSNTTEPTVGVPDEIPPGIGAENNGTPEPTPTETVAEEVTPEATEPLPASVDIAADTTNLGATTVIPSNSNVLLQISNDGTARFNDYGNNTYHFFSPTQSGTQGMNALHITTNASSSRYQVTFSSDQAGVFYLTDTGGRGWDDNGILMLAVNGTIPDGFRVTVKASGYRWTPVPADTKPAFDDITYVSEALNETFTKDDFLYGPQIWRPCAAANFPIFDGQDMMDTENTFSILFIDLNAGILGANTLSQPSFSGQSVTDNGAIKVEYAFENLPTFAAFDAYAYTVSSNQGQGIRWTNRLNAADASGYAVTGAPISAAPVADFTANVTSGEAPLAVQFTDLSTGSPASWAWDFENDGVIDSTELNPVHTYTAAGTYTVNLTVTNAAGSDSEVKTDYITITPQTAQTWTVGATGSDFTTVTDAINSASVVDGDTIYVYNGTYPFTDRLAKSVTLTGEGHDLVTLDLNNAGVTITGTGTIIEGFRFTNGVLTFPPTSGGAKNVIVRDCIFESMKNPGTASGSVVLSGTNTILRENEFRNNTVYNLVYVAGTAQLIENNTFTNTTHTAKLKGVIRLATGNGHVIRNNTFADNQMSCLLLQQPVAAPTVYLNNFNVPDGIAPVRVQGSAAPSAFPWNTPIEYSYTYQGNAYTKVLGNHWNTYAGTDADGDGIGDTPYSLVTNQVDSAPLMAPVEYYIGATMAAPTANFTATPNSGDVPLAVTFTDLSTVSPTSWAWDFENDGIVDSTEQNPSHIYTTAGTYTVNLTVANAAGSDSEIKTDYITVTEPAGTPQAPDRIEVAPLQSEVTVGDGMQLTATVYDADGVEIPGAAVTWSSGNDAIGTVDAAGYFSALSTGTITITATTGNVSGTANVTVQSQGGVMPAANAVFLNVANDDGAKFDAFGNNTYRVLWTGGGLNSLHISDGVTMTQDQSGTFYVTTTGGRGYQDDIILLVAVNGTIPDNFRMHVKADGYVFEPNPVPHSAPDLSTITYEPVTLDEWFTKDDLIYGPQTWRPAGSEYPVFPYQDIADSSNTFRMMAIDLKTGVLSGKPVRVQYEFRNLQSFAALNVYGYAKHINSGGAVVSDILSWTNRLTDSPAEWSGWYVTGVPQSPVETVTITPPAAEVPVNGKITLSAKAYDTLGEEILGTTFDWASADTNVGTVDDDGVFVPVATGETDVFATAGNVTGSAHITVGSAVALVLDSVIVSPSDLTLFEDETATWQFSAAGLNQFGDPYSDAAFTWTSSDPAVGTVTDTGLFTLAGPGTTTVTAVSGGVEGSAVVTIRERPGWTLDLKGASDTQVDRAGFIDIAAASPLTYLDNRENLWGGTDLKALLGLVDDDDPATFNATKAAAGYIVTVKGSGDGDSSSAQLDSTVLVSGEEYIVANTLSGKEIPDSEVDGRLYWPLYFHSTGEYGTGKVVERVTKISLSFPVADVATIELTPAEAHVWSDGTLQFSAKGFNATGGRVEDVEFLWASSTPAVGNVDANGLFTPLAAGETVVSASAAGVSVEANVTVHDADGGPCTWHVEQDGSGDFSAIKDAIAFARNDDTVIVGDGVWGESVTISKHLNFTSAHGPSATTLSNVAISAHNVRVSGFTFKGSGSAIGAQATMNCEISGNVIEPGFYSGVTVQNSNSVKVTGNTINLTEYGIIIEESNNCEVTDNSILATDTGIRINFGSGNIFSGNTIESSGDRGMEFLDSTSTQLLNNHIKGPSFSMIVTMTSGTPFSLVTGNSFTGKVSLSKVTGYFPCYLNDFTGAELRLRNCAPLFGFTAPTTYLYNGTTYTGCLGNYYGKYNGADADGDGIGDTPYTVSSYTDSYPLVAPITGYQILESAPKVIVAPASATLDVDESMNFTVNVYDADGVLMSDALPVWSSSNTTVGVVDAATGFFEALSAGTTTVTATAEGVTSLAHVTVTLPDVPVANFTAMPLSGDAPLYVQFTDTSTGSITSRSWDFDNDGVIDSTEQNATHTYTAAGNYTVNLTVANAAGSNTTVKTDYITVSSGSSGGDAPVANFTANVTSGDAPLTVAFTDTSSGSPTAWTWDFENNGVVDSYEQNPAHTYTVAGIYTVNLTVTNNGGSDSAVKTDYITVTGSTGPSVLLDYNNIFVKVANDRGVKYNAFGNNTYNIRFEGYDRGLNALHISTDPASNYGQVTVSENQSGTFYATDSGGKGYEDEIILMVAVNGTIPDDFRLRITADGYTWTPNPASNQPPSLDNVTYQASSLDEVFTKDDFIYGPQIWKPTGNGFDYPIYAGQNMSDTENTFHLLFIDLNAGVLRPNTDLENRGAVRINYAFENLETFAAFNVYAYCQNSNNGDNMVAWSNAVLAPKAMSGYSVTGVPYTPPSAPVADFTATPLSGEAPLTVAFTDTSSGSPTAWAWDFENNGVVDSTEQSPQHTYETAGTYTVNLTVTNAGGSDSKIKTDYITATESAGPSGPRTWTVGASGCDFVTLADALGSSSVIEGDTVFVYNGTYAVNGAIKPVSITGEGAEIVTLDLGGNTMRISGDGTIVERVRFTNGQLYFSSSGGVSIPPTNTIVRNCIFENMKNPGTAAGAVYLGLTNNTLIDNTFRNNNVYNLIYIASGTGSRIENNTFTNTTSTATLRGVIRMAACGDAIICNNSFSDNAMPCILIQSMIKTGNKIYLNDFVVPDGINPVKIQGTNAAAAFPWVTPQETTYTYQGSSYTKVLGNYWNTYEGMDADGDGVGDTPYSLVTNQIDEAPLMSSVQTYFRQSTSPIALFTANITSGEAPLAVQFTDASTGSPTFWAWDFENDGVIDSTEQNPVHTYTTPGTYTVNLTVTNDAGSSSATTSITVAKPQIPKPVAGFAANVTSGDVPLAVAFTDTSTGADSWSWSFGDGATSTDQNPVHTYTQVGRFTVTLTVANTAGSDSATGVVTARDIPPAPPKAEENFTLGDDAVGVTTGEGGQQVTINATAGLNVTGNDIHLQTGGLTVTIKTEGLIDNASTGNVTGNVTGVHLESAPVNATVGSAGNVSVSFAAEMDNYDPALGITTTIYDQPGDATKTAFALAAQDEGSEIAGIAYAVYFNKTTPTDTIHDAVLRLTVSPDWVDRNGGIKAIKIFRLGDDGNRSVLETTYRGMENGMMVFTAVSPEGFSAFAIGATASPAPAPVSSGSSSGSSTAVGAASNLKAGESAVLAMRTTAISAVTVTTNHAVKDVMVTVAPGTLPRAAEPPADTLYQYVRTTLYRAAADNFSSVQLRFAVPTAWIADHGCTAEQIALLRHTAGGWQNVPVEVLGDENGNAVFIASPDAFGLFAIAATGEVPGAAGDATSGPTAAETPAGTATTAPPADTTPATPQATPLPVWAAILAFGVLLLVRRT